MSPKMVSKCPPWRSNIDQTEPCDWKVWKAENRNPSNGFQCFLRSRGSCWRAWGVNVDYFFSSWIQHDFGLDFKSQSRFVLSPLGIQTVWRSLSRGGLGTLLGNFGAQGKHWANFGALILSLLSSSALFPLFSLEATSPISSSKPSGAQQHAENSQPIESFHHQHHQRLHKQHKHKRHYIQYYN